MLRAGAVLAILLAAWLARGSVRAEPSGAGRTAMAPAPAPDDAEAALAALETALAGAGWPISAGRPDASLARALTQIDVAASSDAGCARIVARMAGRLPELSRRAASPAALDAVAACSQRIGLDALADRLRSARVRDFGETTTTRRLAEREEILADGPLRAAAAYERGEFATVEAMAGADAWARLSRAARTVARARQALADTAEASP